MNNSNNKIEINVPDVYGRKQQSAKKTPDAKIDAITSGSNRVRKIVIKGILRHDTSSNEQEQ